MEILKEVSVDWLSKKWWFFGLSWILIVLGVIGYIYNKGFNFGIDFTGGTIIYLKFKQTPNLDLIRATLKPESSTPPLIQRYDLPEKNTIQVRMQTALKAGKKAEAGPNAPNAPNANDGHSELLDRLRKAFDKEHIGSSQIDFNNVKQGALEKYLLNADADNLKAQNKTTQELTVYYNKLTQSILNYRNKEGEGLVNSLRDLKKADGVTDATIASIEKSFYAGPFAEKSVESVGAIVGSDLRARAELAVGLSFLGMLVYIGWRFKPIYGVAAVVALLHDLAVTLGLFALTQKEISLTVIAALLTLLGYSMNDTIVIFDRVRENLRLQRKESLYRLLNLSINQTLSRTIMTSGMTFLSVFALYVFGGEVLHGFSFALTVGIIIGTYSSIAIASPIVEWWYRGREQKEKRTAA